MNHQLPTFVDYYFKSQFIIKVIITKRAFAIPTKLLMSQLELCQSTKIVLELAVFHSQSGAVRVMAVKKVNFVTSREALRLWKLFFTTVSIT